MPSACILEGRARENATRGLFIAVAPLFSIVRGVSDAVISKPYIRHPLVLLAFGVLFVLLLRSAWLSEDSYISFRVVENFVEGHGLRWNPDERVQVYTNPLWVMLVSALVAVTGEFVVTVSLLSIAVSLGAVLWTLPRAAATAAGLFTGLALLFVSRAWIDYATSGLENPMTCLVLGPFILLMLREKSDFRGLACGVLLSSLAAVNRLDAILFFAPGLLWMAWKLLRLKALPSWPKTIAWLALASLPLWGWLIFATIYYGFPLPNTYYAKLGTGIPKIELYAQGLLYYLNSVSFDPVTLIGIAFAGVLSLRSRQSGPVLLFVGVLLYLAYIVSVGGDFMSGRFFAAPVFVCAALIARLIPEQRAGWIAALAIFLLGFLAPNPTFLYREDRGPVATGGPGDFENFKAVVDHRGIADERAFVYRSTGLLPLISRERLQPQHPFVSRGKQMRAAGEPVAIMSNAGLAGFYAGPDVHIVDNMGLCDALLAKLPLAASEGKSWRVGHYLRDIPEGYLETIASGQNQITDPKIAALYDSLHLVTSGPLFAPERWQEIWRWNTGYYKKALKE